MDAMLRSETAPRHSGKACGEAGPGPRTRASVLSGDRLTLALLTVPVVIDASEEALAAVPRSMREGSLACDASRWQPIRYVRATG